MIRKNLWPLAFFSLLITAVFLMGFFLGSRLGPRFGGPITTGIETEYIRPFTDAWGIVHDQYLNQPLDDSQLMQGAIRGLMESLEDPYSTYMDPQEFAAQSNALEGEYTGIGAWVDTSGEFLVMISPMPDSPAEEAGIMPGDIVVGVDGEDVTDLDPVIVLSKIIGPEGTIVQLTIRRDDETLEFEIERAVIQVPSIESSLLEGGIGYIRLYSFGANSSDEVEDAWRELQGQGAEKLVFDLRNNSGGFVDSAVNLTSLFLEEGEILIEEWADGTRKTYEHTGQTLDTESPMVVLVNEGTASASEIMAGALQDYGRARLIGTSTFGKGYIQNWVPLDNDFGALRITIARWLTPEGRQIQGSGLAPNISVPITQEDIDTQNDRQLNRAINYLNNLEP